MLYTIYVELHVQDIPQDSAEAMLDAHRQWFKEHFEASRFVMVGPCLDVAGTGMIIAQGESVEAMHELIKGDVYYADQLATYTIHPFDVKMFNPDIANYIG